MDRTLVFTSVFNESISADTVDEPPYETKREDNLLAESMMLFFVVCNNEIFPEIELILLVCEVSEVCNALTLSFNALKYELKFCVMDESTKRRADAE